MSHEQELAHPELAGVQRRRGQRRPLPQRRDPQGRAGRRCRLRHLHGRPVRPKALAMTGRQRRRHPQLRPHARVPRVDLLRGSEDPGEGERRTEEPDRPARRRREAARRSADRDDQEAGGQAGRGAEIRLPLQQHGRLPQARADVRGHRGQRLQRRRAVDQVERSARRGRLDRPGRGPSRGGDPPAEQGGTGSGSLRPLARRSAGAEGCRTVHRVVGREADDGSR